MLSLKKDVLYKTLKAAILRGEYPNHFKLPKEPDLARELGVAKVTLRSALARLEREGCVARIPSKGTFVTFEGGDRPEAGRILILTPGMLMDRIESPCRHVLPGLEARAAELGVGSVTCEREYLESLDGGELRRLGKSGKFIGIAVLASKFNGSEKLLERLRKTGLPVVLPCADEEDNKTTGFATVRNDERAAWSLAVGHLASKGHEKIGSVLLGWGDARPVRGHSLGEHKRLLEKNGADGGEGLMFFISRDRREFGRSFEEYYKESGRPTAILCHSDFFAAHVYEALKRMKARIPEDTAVMGICGYPGAALLSPALSTVDFQYLKAGRAAADVLRGAEKWFGAPRTAVPDIVVEHVLVERESTDVVRAERALRHS